MRMGGCSSKKKNQPSTKDLNSQQSPPNGCSESIIGIHDNYSLNQAPLGSKCPETIDETDSCQQSGTSRNQDVIYTTRTEINFLLLKISEFQGLTEKDRNYRYLDEMLTRCILNLDGLECNSCFERSKRKQAIRGANEAIALLERKLQINLDLEELKSSLSKTT